MDNHPDPAEEGSKFTGSGYPGVMISLPRPESSSSRRLLVGLAAVLLSLALGSCAPYGRIWTPAGVERLRAAWFSEITSHGQKSIVLLLANSDLDCSAPDSQDPDAIREAQYQLANALTREGARIVGLQLFAANTHQWKGEYEILNPLDPAALAGSTPRQAQALYLSINEAVAEEMDGIYRQYSFEDKVEMLGVPEPGDVSIEEASGEQMDGAFYLPSIDVSGTFHASACDAESTLIGRFYGEGLLD